MQAGDECYCGNDDSAFIPAQSAECNTPCSGDSTETCGGSWRLNLFTAESSQMPESLPSNLDEDSKIVGGFHANKTDWPFIAKLNIGCGASILSSKWLLTAAHCCEVHPTIIITGAQKGGYSFTGDTNEKQYKIKNIIIHEKYGVAGFEYGFDFCLLETEETMELDGTYSGTVSLPDRAPKFPSPSYKCSIDLCSSDKCCKCAVAGYGTTQYEGLLADALMATDVNLIDNHVCSDLVSGFHQESEFCAGYLEGGRDSCQGDSGGPLVCYDRYDNAILTGVVSWGYKCAVAHNPGIYGKVFTIVDWINGYLDGSTETTPEHSAEKGRKPLGQIIQFSYDYLRKQMADLNSIEQKIFVKANI